MVHFSVFYHAQSPAETSLVMDRGKVVGQGACHIFWHHCFQEVCVFTELEGMILGVLHHSPGRAWADDPCLLAQPQWGEGIYSSKMGWATCSRPALQSLQ